MTVYDKNQRIAVSIGRSVMKMNNKNIACWGALVCAIPPFAFAEFSQWSTGVVAAYSPAVYKNTPSNQVIVPMIGYEGEHVFLRGVSAGYRLMPIRSKKNVIFRLIYDPRTLQPKDSDNKQILGQIE